MFDKTKIFNLALSALFLQKKISNADTDTSTETKILNVNWEPAFWIGLQELDLDSVSTSKALELIKEDPNPFWTYAYKYPNDCVFLRRIRSQHLTDDTETFIDKKIEMLDGEKVILTNEQFAVVEYIPNTVIPDNLTAEAAMFIAYKLARMSAPLIVGKNSKDVIQLIEARYQESLLSARAKDNAETSIYQPEYMRSEFVKARLS